MPPADAPGPPPPAALSREAAKIELKARLARVEGQLRGIQRMIDRDADCEAIAQQLAAARGALSRAFAELIRCALEHRLGGEGHNPADAELTEITRLISRYG